MSSSSATDPQLRAEREERATRAEPFTTLGPTPPRDVWARWEATHIHCCAFCCGECSAFRMGYAAGLGAERERTK